MTFEPYPVDPGPQAWKRPRTRYYVGTSGKLVLVGVALATVFAFPVVALAGAMAFAGIGVALPRR